MVDGREVWRRGVTGDWSQVAVAKISLQSITAVEETVFAGAMDDGDVARFSGRKRERLEGFDKVSGRATSGLLEARG